MTDTKIKITYETVLNKIAIVKNIGIPLLNSMGVDTSKYMDGVTVIEKKIDNEEMNPNVAFKLMETCGTLMCVDYVDKM